MAIKKFFINNQQHKLQFIKQNYVEINGKKVEILKYFEHIDKIIIKINNKLYKATIKQLSQYEFSIYIYNFNKSFIINTKKNFQINPAILDNNNQLFQEKLTSPISGRILKINFKENDFIKKNQTILTIESMKMENEIKAHTDCFIKKIQICESDLVKSNQVLMIFSKKGDMESGTESKHESKKVSNRRTI